MRLYASFLTLSPSADAQKHFCTRRKMQERVGAVFRESVPQEHRFSVCVCVFVFAVRQGCVLCKKAWLGPAASQEDRRGSRWTGLDLTLPTPFYPPSRPSLPLPPSLPPASSNLHAALCEMKAGQQQSVVLL